MPVIQVHFIRIILYFVLFIFALILLALCAARLHYTTHAYPAFYDPIVAELVATTILTVFWAAFAARTIYGRYEHQYLSTFLEELVILFILFILWVVGAGVASTWWGDLAYCSGSSVCQLLSAIIGFAWLGWIAILILFVLSALFAFANKAFREPLHGRWDPRATLYRN